MKNANQESILLRNLVSEEVRLGLYDIQIQGLPLWRILRFRMRVTYLNKKMSYKYTSKKRKLFRLSLLFDFILSSIQLVKLCGVKNRRENIIFSFPRLQKINGYYMDKFTDPVIINSSIKKSFYVFQKPFPGSVSPQSQRYKSDGNNVVKTDFIDRLAMLIGYIFLPITSVVYSKKLFKIYVKSKKIFYLTPKLVITLGARVGGFIVYFYIYYVILWLLRPKRVFVVSREVFFPVIRVCKKLNIPVFEFQHGATYGETPLYSGDYDKRIDPDYFLTFGDIWSEKQFFGMPIDRIINIGWAYPKVIDTITQDNNFPSNYILVISEPSKSKTILDIIVSLATKYANCIFHIRLHPDESYSSNSLMTISQYENILIENNSIDSYLSVSQYKTVIGENSTVLYEALSLGKKVGRLAYNGLEPLRFTDIKIDGFVYINNQEMFQDFIDMPTSIKFNFPSAFSEFDKDAVNNLPRGI